jgi:hypothetical protein
MASMFSRIRVKPAPTVLLASLLCMLLSFFGTSNLSGRDSLQLRLRPSEICHLGIGVLCIVVVDRRLDGILCKLSGISDCVPQLPSLAPATYHAAVKFYRRQAQFLSDLCVLNFGRLTLGQLSVQKKSTALGWIEPDRESFRGQAR